MAESAERGIPRELEERRLLTEVTHLREGRNPDGSHAVEALEAVFENLVTKVQEDAMSSAVSATFQPMAEVQSQNGERRRTFIWKGLGRTALEVAESGVYYHQSKAALDRMAVEISEARRSESELRSGVAQNFISPRMSRTDASYKVAKMEHLADEDTVRVCSAVTDATGKVIGRRTKSLLARDIPLEAWVRMLRDPNNIFGKAITVEHETSALSVMKIFDQLDLPEEALPEGPVSIIENVARYIDDPDVRASVASQIVRFRSDQARLRFEAEITACEWLTFEEALADSLDDKDGIMNDEVQRFVVMLQSQWSTESLRLLKRHKLPVGYRMSDELAAHLEQAWQKTYLSEAAITVGDRRALKTVDAATVERLTTNAQFIRLLQNNGYDPAMIAGLRAEHLREVAIAHIKPGGGCSGVNNFRFGKELDDPFGVSGLPEDTVPGDDASNEGIGEIHTATCRTVGCPSRPLKTKVGGCDVCLKYCQPLWDKGKNPEDVYRGKAPTDEKQKRAKPRAGKLALTGAYN